MSNKLKNEYIKMPRRICGKIDAPRRDVSSADRYDADSSAHSAEKAASAGADNSTFFNMIIRH